MGKLIFSMINCLCLLLLSLPVACFAADWSAVANTKSTANTGVQYREVKFRSEATTATMHVAVFNEKNHDISVIDDADLEHNDLADAAQQANWIAGVNGGYFHPDYTPLGLVVENGEVTHGQQRASLLSGILAANHKRIYLLRPEEFKLGPRTRTALQAGPFLVDRGKPVAGLNSSKRARRTFVATDGKGFWAIGTISPLTLAESGSLLASKAFTEILPVQRALNLDGGSSSAFFFRRADGNSEYLRALTRVRNYLGVVSR